jgi:hypothetical protein
MITLGKASQITIRSTKLTFWLTVEIPNGLGQIDHSTSDHIKWLKQCDRAEKFLPSKIVKVIPK